MLYGRRPQRGGLMGVFRTGLTLAATAASASAALAEPPSTGRTPRVNYMLHCQGCHLPGGQGQPGKVPALKGELGRFLDVEGGRAFIVQVPGTANSKLNDADTAALLNWLIVTMGPGPARPYQPYTTVEVARYRARRLQNVPAIRAALVAKFAPPAGN